MPERYDMAVYAAGLRLRGAILSEVRKGWRRRGDFEVGSPERDTGRGAESGSEESTSSEPPPVDWGDKGGDPSRPGSAAGAVSCGDYF